MRSEIYLSLEWAGEEAYALNLTMAGVVLLALNTGLFGWYSFSAIPPYSLAQAMEIVFTANLAASAFMSLLALRKLPRLLNNARDNLLLGLSCSYLLAFLALDRGNVFASIGAYQLAVMSMSVLIMLAVPLAMIVSAEKGARLSLVLSVQERI